MGGGRNGRFWGHPDVGPKPWKIQYFPQKIQNRGAPKTAALDAPLRYVIRIANRKSLAV